jgi:hypothetical protein
MNYLSNEERTRFISFFHNIGAEPRFVANLTDYELDVLFKYSRKEAASLRAEYYRLKSAWPDEVFTLPAMEKAIRVHDAVRAEREGRVNVSAPGTDDGEPERLMLSCFRTPEALYKAIEAAKEVGLINEYGWSFEGLKMVGVLAFWDAAKDAKLINITKAAAKVRAMSQEFKHIIPKNYLGGYIRETVKQNHSKEYNTLKTNLLKAMTR